MKKVDGYHDPVLLHRSVEELITNPDGTYVDATLGGGGHTREILKHLSPQGRLFCFDRDPEAHENMPDDPRATLCRSNFSFLRNHLVLHGVRHVDGILADLGVSSHQFDSMERGFSFRDEDALLDMRMNPGQQLDAQQVLNEYEEADLARIFKYYGEVQQSKRLARTIIGMRGEPWRAARMRMAMIATYGEKRGNKLLAQVYQALRIEVNQEMHEVEALLKQSAECIRPGGRFVVISYHSLEDRPVKNYLRTGNIEGKVDKDFFGNLIRPFEPLTSKPIIPSTEEIEKNPRSRSAKMRVGIRNQDQEDK